MSKKPYIILKYAKSIDNFLGQKDKSIWLSNAFSKRLSHKWRSEIDAILVGKGTVLTDNPKLTTRYGFGENPIRVVLDSPLNIGLDFSVFNNEASTIVFTKVNQHSPPSKPRLKYIVPNKWELDDMLTALYMEGIKSIIIEGGQKILHSFVKEELWDEARVFVAQKELFHGLEAPLLPTKPIKEIKILTDTLQIFRNPKSNR